jgi:hypothetical protein
MLGPWQMRGDEIAHYRAIQSASRTEQFSILDYDSRIVTRQTGWRSMLPSWGRRSDTIIVESVCCSRVSQRVPQRLDMSALRMLFLGQ